MARDPARVEVLIVGRRRVAGGSRTGWTGSAEAPRDEADPPSGSPATWPSQSRRPLSDQQQSEESTCRLRLDRESCAPPVSAHLEGGVLPGVARGASEVPKQGR